MIELVRAASMVAATLCTGMTAGVFAANATAVMPGLGRVDDRTFVSAFRSIDLAISASILIRVYLVGALISTGLTARPQLTSGPIGPNRRGPS